MERIKRIRLACHYLGALAIMLSALGLTLAIKNGDVIPICGFLVLGCLSIFTALTGYRRYELEKEKNLYEYKHP